MLRWILAFSLSTAPLLETDTGTVSPSAAPPDYTVEVQSITQEIASQYQAWNARDISGYMAAFWKSPLLIYIVDSDVLIGWDRTFPPC